VLDLNDKTGMENKKMDLSALEKMGEAPSGHTSMPDLFLPGDYASDMD